MMSVVVVLRFAGIDAERFVDRAPADRSGDERNDSEPSDRITCDHCEPNEYDTRYDSAESILISHLTCHDLLLRLNEF